MVGVAGRSKACYDCKRRRVKCDLTVPLCRRCSKAGIQCRGYQRDTLWINRTPDQPSVTALSVISNAQTQQSRRGQSPLSLGRLHNLNQLRASLYYHSSLGMSQQDSVNFRQYALPILQDIYLPRDQPQGRFESDDMDTDPSPSSWIKAICNMQGPSAALDFAILAFCAIQVRLSGDLGISYDETVQLYNDALGKIIHDLDPRQGRRDDETIGAIIMLSTCEVFIFSADTSWSAHAHGISEILRDRKPAAESRMSSSRSLLRRLCVVCVIYAMSRRRSLNLEPNRWRQLLGPPDCPGSFSELLDATIAIPSIMQQVYSLPQQGNQQSINTRYYFSGLMAKYYELEQWLGIYQRREADRTKAPFYWAVPSKAHNPTDEGYEEQLFPFALMFSSVQSAVPWLLCVTFMLGILDCIQVLQAIADANTDSVDGEPIINAATSDSVAGLDGSESAKHGPFAQANADRLARKMCQAIEFCYRSENGTFGAQATCSSQCVLLRYFERRGLARELEWCRAIKEMKCPGSNFGMDLMQMGLFTDDDV